MDFALSAEQRELTEAATGFARRELNQDLVKREAAGEFPREAWRACARFGIQSLPVPAGLDRAGPAGRGGRHYILGHLGDPAGGTRPDTRALSHPGWRGIPGGAPGRGA